MFFPTDRNFLNCRGTFWSAPRILTTVDPSLARLFLSMFLMLTSGYVSHTKSTLADFEFDANDKILPSMTSTNVPKVSGMCFIIWIRAMPSNIKALLDGIHSIAGSSTRPSRTCINLDLGVLTSLPSTVAIGDGNFRRL